jgi:hypothetical protein
MRTSSQNPWTHERMAGNPSASLVPVHVPSWQMDADSVWAVVLSLVGVGMLVVAIRWLREAPLALDEASGPLEPSRSSVDDEEDVHGEDSIVLGVKELWVSPMMWSSWRESARKAIRQAAATSALIGVAVGLLSLRLAVEMIAGPEMFAAVIYAPLVALVAWYGTRAFVRRLRFSRTARQMKEAIVPTLLNSPDPDDLLKLARLGAGAFAQESIIIRAEQRGAAIYLVATEYDVSKGEWFGGGDAGFG